MAFRNFGHAKYHFEDEDFDELSSDLSRIGEVLAVRGELEDRILAALRPV